MNLSPDSIESRIQVLQCSYRQLMGNLCRQASEPEIESDNNLVKDIRLVLQKNLAPTDAELELRSRFLEQMPKLTGDLHGNPLDCVAVIQNLKAEIDRMFEDHYEHIVAGLKGINEDSDIQDIIGEFCKDFPRMVLTYHGEKPFLNFLRASVKNAKRRYFVRKQPANPPVGPTEPDRIVVTDKWSLRRDLEQMIGLYAIRYPRTSPLHIQVIRMRLQECRYNKIAEALGIRADYARKIAQRAKNNLAKLKKELERRK